MERTEDMTRASGPELTLEGSYIDWAAVAGGGVVAVAVGSVFAAFGAGLGLSTISAEPGEGRFDFMVIVTAVWIVVTLVASYGAGGYIAGRMRRRVDKAAADEVTARDGINGLVVWGLGIVATVFLLGSAVSTTISTAGDVASATGTVFGDVASAAGSVVGGAAEGTMSAAGAMLPESATTDPVGYVSDALLRPAQVGTGATDPAATAASTAAILGNVVVTGEISDAERNYLVSAVVSSTGLTPPEANARVDEAIAAAQQARANAAQLMSDAQAEVERLQQEAIDAAEVARVSAILTGFILAAAAMVAAAAAFIGSVRGGRHRDEGKIFGGFAYRG
jgi:hypothetical protein